jgi:P-type Cu2+ transporter
LELRAVSQARGALNALAALLPDTAERVIGQETQTVPLSELHVGDIVLVRPGTRVPADGTVVEGAAEVDESMITGESRAVSKGLGAALDPWPFDLAEVNSRQAAGRFEPCGTLV